MRVLQTLALPLGDVAGCAQVRKVYPTGRALTRLSAQSDG
jgi:hypothetical protein